MLVAVEVITLLQIQVSIWVIFLCVTLFLLLFLRKHLLEFLIHIIAAVRRKVSSFRFIVLISLMLSSLPLPLFFVLPRFLRLLVPFSCLPLLLLQLLGRGDDEELLHFLQELKTLGVAAFVRVQLQRLLLEGPLDCRLAGGPCRHTKESPCSSLLERLQTAVGLLSPILERDNLVMKLLVAQHFQAPVKASPTTRKLLHKAARIQLPELALKVDSVHQATSCRSLWMR
mmetsp:Transcript_95127/g.307159  ORF Transcript_95127/g.307159 Transcript_95127/m.307159 type:complete len:228 (+) Transcript_95127:937-1620(+)